MTTLLSSIGLYLYRKWHKKICKDTKIRICKNTKTLNKIVEKLDLRKACEFDQWKGEFDLQKGWYPWIWSAKAFRLGLS